MNGVDFLFRGKGKLPYIPDDFRWQYPRYMPPEHPVQRVTVDVTETSLEREKGRRSPRTGKLMGYWNGYWTPYDYFLVQNRTDSAFKRGVR